MTSGRLGQGEVGAVHDLHVQVRLGRVAAVRNALPRCHLVPDGDANGAGSQMHEGDERASVEQRDDQRVSGDRAHASPEPRQLTQCIGQEGQLRPPRYVIDLVIVYIDDDAVSRRQDRPTPTKSMAYRSPNRSVP